MKCLKNIQQNSPLCFVRGLRCQSSNLAWNLLKTGWQKILGLKAWELVKRIMDTLNSKHVSMYMSCLGLTKKE